MLDLLYAQAVAARRRWFERHPEARRRLRHPVISIGNVSVGGTGKTPLVAAVADWLIARGERPAILSRGYARRDVADGVVVVADGTRTLATLERAGDEPLMLARRVPRAIVAVGEDRYLAGAIAERRLGATVHVLDDGFQHLALARDLDVLVTSPAEITGGRVLPFGRLRESVDAAARADVVVVVGADLAGARSEAWALGISQAVGARRVLPGPLDVGPPRDSVGGSPVFAFAGIGHPEQFFAGLREAGWNVCGTRAFADHHHYSDGELRAVADAARAASAETIVTTEKDAVRLDARGHTPFAWTAVPMTLGLDSWDTLAACLETTLERR